MSFLRRQQGGLVAYKTNSNALAGNIIYTFEELADQAISKVEALAIEVLALKEIILKQNKAIAADTSVYATFDWDDDTQQVTYPLLQAVKGVRNYKNCRPTSVVFSQHLKEITQWYYDIKTCLSLKENK